MLKYYQIFFGLTGNEYPKKKKLANKSKGLITQNFVHLTGNRLPKKNFKKSKRFVQENVGHLAGNSLPPQKIAKI